MADPRYRRITALKPIRSGTSSRKTRIRIPQPVKRPLQLRGSVVRKSLLRENPDWWILHRRGVRRPKMGLDPLEARAVSRESVVGYLNERVVYKWLTVNKFSPHSDFSFQSSQQGGRLEIGGMVVDFLFPYMKIALNVQGPGHEERLRHRKDQEQVQMLADMGYTSIEVDIKTIASQYVFDVFMRRIFSDRTIDASFISVFQESGLGMGGMGVGEGAREGVGEGYLTYPELESYVSAFDALCCI